MRPLPVQAVRALRRRVLRYYESHGRELAWRRTRDPYAILVSEIMLQQTQVQRVVAFYEKFLHRFPTLADLAGARFSDVLRVWIGLGYNSRALRLWQAARLLAADGGAIPAAEDDLRKLPGIGQYTAAALRAFAFDCDELPIDVNVARVLSRVLWGSRRMTPVALKRIAGGVVPRGRAAAFAQGLMDIGARFCSARPRCAACPLRSGCRWHARASAHHKTIVCKAQRPAQQYHGSRRFFRGRIMAALARHRSLSVPELGRKVKAGFALSDRPWLQQLLQDLAREGLVRWRPREPRVTLP